MILTRGFLFCKDQIWSRIFATVCFRLHEYNNVFVKVPDSIHLQGNVLDLTFIMFSVFVRHFCSANYKYLLRLSGFLSQTGWMYTGSIYEACSNDQ